jgi:hypothetical protein
MCIVTIDLISKLSYKNVNYCKIKQNLHEGLIMGAQGGGGGAMNLNERKTFNDVKRIKCYNYFLY